MTRVRYREPGPDDIIHLRKATIWGPPTYCGACVGFIAEIPPKANCKDCLEAKEKWDGVKKEEK
jgi:hypothetical protein